MLISRWWLCGLLVLGLGAPVHAQGDIELAKQYFKLGENLYQRADYAQALKYFRLSHENSGRPELLYNIARCYELLGQPKEAISYYQRYVKGTNKDTKIVQARIANLKKRITRHSQEPPAPPPKEATPPPRPVEKTTGERLEVSDETREPPVDPIASEKEEEAPMPGRSPVMRIVSWSLIGAGAAFLVTGSILGGIAAGKASDVEAAGAEGGFWEDSASTYSDGESLEKAQVATLIVGGALAVGGIVTMIIDLTSSGAEEKPEASAHFMPVIGQGIVGLNGLWHF